VRTETEGRNKQRDGGTETRDGDNREGGRQRGGAGAGCLVKEELDPGLLGEAQGLPHRLSPHGGVAVLQDGKRHPPLQTGRAMTALRE
jgi:hypothetical protein